MKRGKAKLPTTSAATPQIDLVLLLADKNIEGAVTALLKSRCQALRIRTVNFKAITHPNHDPGCLNQSSALLATYRSLCRHALVVFDREGCGRDLAREDLEKLVEAELAKSGWDNRGVAIVIDPELENWVWGPSPHVASALGWTDDRGDLKEWLVSHGWLPSLEATKPRRPKEAVDAVMKLVDAPRSSAIYQAIAEKVSVQLCTDPAFVKLRETLQGWFPRTQ